LFTQETELIGRKVTQQQYLAEMLSTGGHEVRVIDYDISGNRKGKKGIFIKWHVTKTVGRTHKGSSIFVIYPSIIKLPILNLVSLYFSHRSEINKQIREFKPEVIVGWGIFNSYLAANAAKKNNIPFVYYWIDALHLLTPSRLLKPFGMILEKKTLKKSALVLAVNQKLKDYVTSMGASPDQTRVVRAGINLGQFNPALSGIDTRKVYGLGGKDFVLCFVGWLYHFSRLGNVLHALSKNSNTQLKLLIVGEGEAYNDLEILRDRYKLGERIVFTGKKEHFEIPRLIAAADICILPADPSEPVLQHMVPLKVYEYMAMKKPVITTKLPGVMKEIGEGNGVIYVDQPKDIVKVAEELNNSGYATLMRHGLVASKFVGKHRWDRVIVEFEAVLKKVVEGKSSG
ncbi:MAG: glycosyltransferase family 4 protein, partial [Dehalococcoidia bacterium]